MCIICRNGDPEDFLGEWSKAILHLKKAEKAMYKYGLNDKNYSVFHKKIVRARKDLARLEQERELQDNK